MKAEASPGPCLLKDADAKTLGRANEAETTNAGAGKKTLVPVGLSPAVE